MTKTFLLLMLALLCVKTSGQLGYKYGSSFIELYPDSSSLYYVQTKNTKQMKKIKETVSVNKDGAEIIAYLANNACIVNQKLLGEGNYVSDIYNNKKGQKIIILPRFAIDQ